MHNKLLIFKTQLGKFSHVSTSETSTPIKITNVSITPKAPFPPLVSLLPSTSLKAPLTCCINCRWDLAALELHKESNYVHFCLATLVARHQISRYIHISCVNFLKLLNTFYGSTLIFKIHLLVVEHLDVSRFWLLKI